jgi:hypothetical protein
LLRFVGFCCAFSGKKSGLFAPGQLGPGHFGTFRDRFPEKKKKSRTTRPATICLTAVSFPPAGGYKHRTIVPSQCLQGFCDFVSVPAALSGTERKVTFAQCLCGLARRYDDRFGSAFCRRFLIGSRQMSQDVLEARGSGKRLET